MSRDFCIIKKWDVHKVRNFGVYKRGGRPRRWGITEGSVWSVFQVTALAV